MVNFDFLITGCGRSGTGYMSKLLIKNGFNCGHEHHYGFGQKATFSSESSWLATPHINNHLNSNIIRLIRNPINVIKSWVDLGVFRKKNEYVQYIINYIPDIDTKNKSEIINSTIYYIYWNRIFDELIKDNYYEIVHFDALIQKENVELFGKNLSILNEIVNEKKHGKKDTPKTTITDILENEGYYDKVFDTYNNILTHKFRKI